MGLAQEYVVEGQDAHLAEFTCTICLSLVDAPLLTACNHVFCTSCLQDWFERITKCPTCSSPLDPRHAEWVAQLQELGLSRPQALVALRESGHAGVAAAADHFFTQSTSAEAQRAARRSDDVSWLFG